MRILLVEDDLMIGDVVANSIGGWIGVSLVIVIAEFVAEGRQGQ